LIGYLISYIYLKSIDLVLCLVLRCISAKKQITGTQGLEWATDSLSASERGISGDTTIMELLIGYLIGYIYT
jgi:hypothetical protein